jgi:tripartite-type tricarboxylate transporter receptor subunit TctC
MESRPPERRRAQQNKEGSMKRSALLPRRTLVGAALALMALMAPAAAQDKYPSKPVKIIVPYAPGGATDITARLFGEQLRNILGQQFVVESKPGAFGVLAIEEMARSKPDGYTLMIGNVSTNAITPVLFKNKFTVDFDKSVVSVSRLAIYPSFLITTTKSLDVKSAAELVAHAKKNPGKVKFTSAGIGSFPHFDMEIFAKRAGVDMVHIPNKAGAAGMINDLVVGDVEAAVINSASTAAMIKAGSLRPIAVLAEARLAEYPDVPTLAEAGYPNVGTLHWQSMLAPAGTPKEVLATLHKAILEAAQAPALQEALKKQLVSIKPNPTLEDAQSWLKAEIESWKKIVSEVKIEMN